MNWFQAATVIAFAIGLIAGALSAGPLIRRRYRAGYRAGLHQARQTVLLANDPKSAQLSSAHIACEDLRIAIAAQLSEGSSLPSTPSIVPLRRRGA